MQKAFMYGQDADGVWRPLRSGATGLPVGAVLISGNTVVKTSISGTITTGGTAQQIAAAKADRQGFMIQNQSSGDLYFSTLAAASIGQPSLKLSPGQTYESPAHGVPPGAISIIGATTGQAFAGREW